MYEPTLRNCPDCQAEPGERHNEGCDVERCSSCKGQYLMCECEDHDPRLSIWMGFWPGDLECISREIYCRNENYPGYMGDWIRCEPDHPGARPWLNEWALIEQGVRPDPGVTEAGIKRVREILQKNFPSRLDMLMDWV